MQNKCAVVLCTEDGTRMHSRRPKVLSEVLFRPMVGWIVEMLRSADITDVCLVCPNVDEGIQQAVPGVEFAVQSERLGTAHAVLQARTFLERHASSSCAVLCGDTPLLPASALLGAHQQHLAEQHAVTVLAAELENPYGYGRIVREFPSGSVCAMVEQADTDASSAAIREVNTGAFWFETSFLLQAASCNPKHQQGAYNLTDVVAYAARQSRSVGAYKVEQPELALGVNDCAGLLRLNELARHREIQRHLAAGVEFVSTDGVIIGPDVQIGSDTCILPGVILRGRVHIGSGCTIGPNALLEDCEVGDHVTINASQLFSSRVGTGARVGPFAYVRPGCVIADYAKIGDFVELKNSTIGAHTSIAHLSYIGDTDLGINVNMGGGIITCNYDGLHKHRTVVADHAFVGCNTNLVAPVTVGEGAYVAAGSTITEDVPAQALAIARARQANKLGRAAGRTKPEPSTPGVPSR